LGFTVQVVHSVVEWVLTLCSGVDWCSFFWRNNHRSQHTGGTWHWS